MGRLHQIYNYERDTSRHYAFLQSILKRTHLGISITANLNHQGTNLYMVVPTLPNNLLELTGLPHCWLTMNECNQTNPYDPYDNRFLHALEYFKLEMNSPDYNGPFKTARNSFQRLNRL